MMKSCVSWWKAGGAGLALGMLCLQVAPLCAVEAYYAEPQVYGMRPNPRGEFHLGPIGATGIETRIYKGVKVTVEETIPHSPADGKFSKGDIILGVNGEALKGKNPLVILGTALTGAEGTDGVLTFDVQPSGGGDKKQVTVKIPVLGTYSDTFPLQCEKSNKIIEKAAEFHAGEDRLKTHDLWNALTCLFLLSTGDDKYVPRVKQYFAQFLNKDGSVRGIGAHSWFNGYNGVACAEYYLRTGDRSVLPILQHYCDDAKERQKYGVGWSHWGHGANPAYEGGGGMMHGAGNQMLLTLMLGKVCGVEVDDKTLLGSLKHWYRFVGHGAIPVSDQRYWHGFRSAGRDGATAAVMHIASGATGDVTIYKKAKEYLAMSVLTSWPSRNYHWEVYWHSLSSQFMLDYDPNMYHETMQRFRWRYDLGRTPSGGFAWSHNPATKDPMKAGIALALAYTAPRRTLQITGAKRSSFAHDFTLPERLWGTEADLAFLTSKHHKDFYKYGDEEEIHIPYWQLPLRLQYGPGDVKDLPRDVVLKNAHHARCTIRGAAAKALCMNRQFGELEKLLQSPDPRLRRAGLDGVNDNHPWFTAPVVGRHALKADDYTPAMMVAIDKIMSDREEAWFVTEGALHALNHAPVKLIKKNIPNILPWTTHDDWWLREAAFRALMGLQGNEELFVEHLPPLIEMMIKEYRYNPRFQMMQQLKDAMATRTKDSPAGRLILAGFTRAAKESEVLPDVGEYRRSIEGALNIIQSAQTAIKLAPESAATLAKLLADSGRLSTLDTKSLMNIVKATDNKKQGIYIGLYPALASLPANEKTKLTRVLYDVFRSELIQRLQGLEKSSVMLNEKENKQFVGLLDMIVELTKLKKPIAGWEPVGAPEPVARTWRYRSFDPVNEDEKLHPRIGPPRRLRDEKTLTLPPGMVGWHLPEFDDGEWERGRTPIGVGIYKAHGHGRGWTATPDFSFKNNSDWGDGEFLVMRTTFDVDDLDYDYYRIRILADQGYHIYLNGYRIYSYVWFSHVPQYREIVLSEKETRHLKKGINTLAARGVVRYEKDRETDAYHRVGQMDLWLECLKKEELGL